MEKRKAFSKARLLKSKLDVKKGFFDESHSQSASRLTKINQISEIVKKNVTPTGQRPAKPKQPLSKKLLDTPKLKPDDFNTKILLTQEPSDSQYMSIISSYMEKIITQKSIRQDLEEKLKHSEMNFRSTESALKKELEKLQHENKQLRKEKLQQENKIIEENFLIRRDHEDCKSAIFSRISEIIALMQGFDKANFKETVEEVLEKVSELAPMEESQVMRVDLKDTASFSYMEPEVITPPSAVSNGFVEAIAMHPHVAGSSEELNLSPGDRVLVFNSDEGNGWWIGKVGDEIGKFPKNCVMLD